MAGASKSKKLQVSLETLQRLEDLLPQREWSAPDLKAEMGLGDTALRSALRSVPNLQRRREGNKAFYSLPGGTAKRAAGKKPGPVKKSATATKKTAPAKKAAPTKKAAARTTAGDQVDVQQLQRLVSTQARTMGELAAETGKPETAIRAAIRTLPRMHTLRDGRTTFYYQTPEVTRVAAKTATKKAPAKKAATKKSAATTAAKKTSGAGSARKAAPAKKSSPARKTAPAKKAAAKATAKKAPAATRTAKKAPAKKSAGRRR